MRKILFLALILFIATPVFARHARVEGAFNKSGFVPAPRLVAPVIDTVNLTGKNTLVFKWSSHEGDPLQRLYYDFRLYNGYNMVGSSLVYKKRVSAREFSIILKSDLFQNGQIYTWSVRQVYDSIRKSRRSTDSFKVIKK